MDSSGSNASISGDRRNRSWLYLKLGLVICGLIFLAYQFFEHAKLQLREDSTLLLISAILANQIALQLFAWRMQIVSASHALYLSHFHSTRIHLQSMFYFFVVPMSVGADLARYVKIRKIAGTTDTLRIVSAVLVDRAIGMLGSLLIVAIALPGIFLQAPNQQTTSLNGWIVALLALIVVAVGYRLRVNPAIADQLRGITKIARTEWLKLMSAIFLTIVMSFWVGLATYFAALAVGIELSLSIAVFGTAAALFGMLIPVSVAGLSAAEAVGAAAFIVLGLPPADAVVLSVIGYFARGIGAIEGGIWEAYDASREISAS